MHSIAPDPKSLLVDPSAADYRLKTASPAVDAGVVLPEVTNDLLKRPRTRGDARDIGCYESD